ncbi:MAG: ABC transporter substrate-binding protein [Pseudomonadota bacterium]
MKRLSVLLFTLLVVYFLSASIRLGYAGEARGVTDDTITIGVILDQTGPAANVTLPMTNAIRRLFRYVNEQGGIHGRKVKVIVEDDRYAVPMAIAAFKKLLYRDKVLALIGPSSSTATLSLLRHMEKEKLPTMPIPPQERCISPLKRYVFGVYEIYPNTMRTIIDYMVKNLDTKDPRIALAYPDNETGKQDLMSATARLKLHNLTPLVQEVVNPASIDATSQVMSMRRYNVNNIILCGFIPQPAGLLLRELKKFGMNVPVFANVAAASEEVIQMAGEGAEKYYVISPWASWYDEGEGVALMREITLKYAPGTEKPYRGKIHTGAWIWATVLKEGLLRAGKDIDGERLVAALETLKDFDMKGLCGPINFSSTNHKAMNTAQISKADPANGKFIPVTGWVKTD